MELIPKEHKFFDLFDQQANNLAKMASFFKQIVKDANFSEENMRKMREFEHEGDTLAHEITDTLNRTFITPFDREDILSLANKLDDVADRMHAMASRMKLYRLNAAPDADIIQFADMIDQSCGVLVKAVNGLRDLKRASRIKDFCIEINRLENLGDQLREAVISRLFDNTTDPIKVIKWKEIYELAESTMDECEHVAKAVESIVVKQG